MRQGAARRPLDLAPVRHAEGLTGSDHAHGDSVTGLRSSE